MARYELRILNTHQKGKYDCLFIGIKFCKQKQDSWGAVKHREQKLFAFLCNPGSQAARQLAVRPTQ
jgi:hypothetical protein